MKDLTTYLHDNFFLSLSAAKQLAAVMTPVDQEKGAVFVKNGSTNKTEYLLLEGICRSFILDQLGAEITLSFFTPNTAISPNLIRTKMNQSILNIQALTAARLVTFSSEDLMALMMEYQEIERWGNAILQSELLQKVNKEINQNSMTAKERLVDFRAQYPSLENLLPHAYIASYLGVTTVSLSRIRKELSVS